MDNVVLPKKKEDNFDLDLKVNKDNFIVSFRELQKFLATKPNKELFKVLLTMLLIVIIIVLLKLPVDLIISLGSNIMNIMGINITKVGSAIWQIMWNVLYTAFALWWFLKLFINRFYYINKPS